MKVVCSLLIALAVMLAACGDEVPKLPKLATTDVVVAFGDSLTYGTGADESESYPAVLGQLIGRTVVRAGVPGETTAQGLARLPEVVDEYKPRLVIVCLGGNDMLRQVRDAEIAQNLRSIIKTLQDKQIVVVLIGVPKPALITSAPVFYADLAKELAIPYEGKVLASVLQSNETKSDPIHPNARGYRRMAEAIAQLLENAGAI
ncbi:MAG TPA: arylesterase [Burkholderiales bacterium]|nr:arylesterase [Burkholderiales bacterium]